MKKNWEPGEKEISSPVRDKGGEIISFKLKNKNRLTREQALIEARQGKLIGINLYPGFVKEVVNQDSKEGLLRKVLQFIKGKIT